MKVKHRLSDFAVVERLRPGLVGESGSHAVYRAEKVGLSTHEAAMRLAREADLPTDAVRFCGLKDRRARAIQHFSIEEGPPIDFAEAGLTVRTIGRSREPARSEWIEANEFVLLVRDLGSEDLASLARN